MHDKTIERREKIESRILAGRASLSDLKTKLAANRSPLLKELFQRPSSGFDDAETILKILDGHPQSRTLEQESFLLDSAEFFLRILAEHPLKAILEMVAKYGPDMDLV